MGIAMEEYFYADALFYGETAGIAPADFTLAVVKI